MSIKTWKDEFYPIEASEVEDDDVKLLEHSIRKWEGLRQENLDKHGVVQKCAHSIIKDRDGDYFSIDTTTCTLCCHYYDDKTDCKNCPLTQYLEKPCDCDNDSPYCIWCDTGDPEPMLEALKETLCELKSCSQNSQSTPTSEKS